MTLSHEECKRAHLYDLKNTLEELEKRIDDEINKEGKHEHDLVQDLCNDVKQVKKEMVDLGIVISVWG